MSRSKNTSRRNATAVVVVTCLLLGATELSAGDSRWYVETKLGQANLDVQLGSRWPKWFDGDHGAASVEFGYTLHRNLALQAGFHDLGEYEGIGSPCLETSNGCIASVDGVLATAVFPPLGLCADAAPCGFVLVPLTAEVSGVSLSAVPQWPFNDRFAVYGKIGVIDWRTEVSGLLDVRREERFSSTELLTGVGVRYTFPKGLGVLAEYQRLDLDLGSTSLGASWRF